MTDATAGFIIGFITATVPPLAVRFIAYRRRAALCADEMQERDLSRWAVPEDSPHDIQAGRDDCVDELSNVEYALRRELHDLRHTAEHRPLNTEQHARLLHLRMMFPEVDE